MKRSSKKPPVSEGLQIFRFTENATGLNETGQKGSGNEQGDQRGPETTLIDSSNSSRRSLPGFPLSGRRRTDPLSNRSSQFLGRSLECRIAAHDASATGGPRADFVPSTIKSSIVILRSGNATRNIETIGLMESALCVSASQMASRGQSCGPKSPDETCGEPVAQGGRRNSPLASAYLETPSDV